jgi:hypothetical protein
MKYRTATVVMIDLERFFVIPDDGRAIEQFLFGGRRISDDIIAQCPTADAAARIAAALNATEREASAS